MRLIGTLCVSVLAAGGCGKSVLAQPEPVLADPVVLCADDESGERIVFAGRVFDMDGQPLAAAAVVAYGADAMGYYAPPEAQTRVPRLRGVAITDERGEYAFETIYPGGYPGRDDPSHIHLTVAAPMHHIEYVTFWFEGDPRLTRSKRRSIDQETVIVELEADEAGVRSFHHDITMRGN